MPWILMLFPTETRLQTIYMIINGAYFPKTWLSYQAFFCCFLENDVTFIFEEFVEIDVVVSSVMDNDEFILSAVWVQKASTTHIQL